MSEAEEQERLNYALNVIRDQEWVLPPTQGEELLEYCEAEIKGSFDFVDVDLLVDCCGNNVNYDADENGIYYFIEWDDAISDYEKAPKRRV